MSAECWGTTGVQGLASKPCAPGCQGEGLGATEHGILASARQWSGVLVFKEWPQRVAWAHEKVQKETPLPA